MKNIEATTFNTAGSEYRKTHWNSRELCNVWSLDEQLGINFGTVATFVIENATRNFMSINFQHYSTTFNNKNRFFGELCYQHTDILHHSGNI